MTKIKIFRLFWPRSKFSWILTKIEIFINIQQNRNVSKFFLPKPRYLQMLTEIEIIRKVWLWITFKCCFVQNRHIGKIENFRQFWPKSIFLKILTSLEIFKNFDQNRHIFKFWPKSTFFRNFDQTLYLGKILSQIDYPEETEIFRKCWQKSRLSSILAIIEIFINIDQNRNFPKILTKIEIFIFFYQHPSFFEDSD